MNFITDISKVKKGILYEFNYAEGDYLFYCVLHDTADDSYVFNILQDNSINLWQQEFFSLDQLTINETLNYGYGYLKEIGRIEDYPEYLV